MKFTTKTISMFIILMTLTCAVIISIAVLSWYQATLELQSQRITEIVKSRRSIIEAVAEYDQAEGKKFGRTLEESAQNTIGQFKEAHKHFSGFGKTGEFTLAQRIDDKIHFVLRHRHKLIEIPKDIQWDSSLAEPMQLALKQQSGIVQGKDYRGIEVLAAYEPIAILGLGLVAKIDISEIRQPFYQYALSFIIISSVAILIGVYIFLRLSKPFVRKIEEDYALLNKVVEGTDDIIFLKDTEGKYIFINAAGEHLYGLRRHEIEGKGPLDILPSSLAKQYINDYKTILETKRPKAHVYEFAIQGQMETFHVQQSPIIDAHGNVNAIVGMARNITKDIELNNRLRRTEDLTKLIANTTLDAIILIDHEAKIIFWNPAATTIFGYSHDEAYGRNPHDFLTSKAERNGAKIGLELFLKSGSGNVKNPKVELKALHKNQQEIDIELSLSALLTDGKWGALAIIRDISAKKVSERIMQQSLSNLEYSSKRYKSLFNTAKIGLLDEDFSYLYTELENLRISGITDISDYLTENLDAAYQLAKLVKINDVNDELLRIFSAVDRDTFYESIDKTFSENSIYTFIKEVAAIWNKESYFGAVTDQLTLDGRPIKIEINIAFPRNREHFKSIPVSISDVTSQHLVIQRKLAFSDISENIHHLDEKSILQLGLGWVEEMTGSKVSFLHFINDDQETIELITWSKRTLETYCHVETIDTHYPITSAGIWADAFRTKEAVIINDYASYKNKKGLPEGHAYLDRFISLPILEGDNVRVLLGVGNKTTAYSNDDVETVQLFADYLWKIVSRKRIEKAIEKTNIKLNESLTRFKQLFDGAQVSLWDIDLSAVNEELNRLKKYPVDDLLDYMFKNRSEVDRLLDLVTIHNVNATTLNLFGFETAEQAAQNFKLIFIEESKNSFVTLLDGLWHQRDRVETISQFKTIRGDLLDAIVSAPLSAKPEDLRHVPISLLDISKQVQALHNLKKEEEEKAELETIMDKSPAVAFLWRNEPGWPVEYVSANVIDWGYSKQQLESGDVSFPSLIEPTDLEDIAKEVALHLKNHTSSFTQVYRIIRPDGSLRWIDDRTWVRYDDEGNATHFQGICLDITEHKELERQLWQAQKSESLGNMAGGIAHDFNNMLLPILALAELTRMQQEPDTSIAKRMDKIIDAGHKAQELVAHLMEFSRTEDVKYSTLNVGGLIDHCVDLLKSTMPATMEIKCENITEDVSIQANSSQLQSVFINLAKNAADALYGSNGTLTIRSRLYNTTENAHRIFKEMDFDKLYVEISIKDDGEGMSEATLSRIFDPFFTTKPVGEGTGMGLAMVHGIITAHKGFIVANSKLGKGSTFDIYLPVVKPE